MDMERARMAAPGSHGGRLSLGESYPAAVSLSFLNLAFFLLVFAAGAAAALFCETLLLGEPAQTVFWAERGARCLVAALALVFFSGPWRLGRKRWYLALDGGYHSPRAAFACFAGGRAYFSAVWYGVVRRLAGFLAFFAPLLPSLVIAAALKAAYETSGELAGGAELLLVALLAVLTVAAVCFGSYVWLGLFFADYRYAQGEHNPFSALRDSWRLAGGGRAALALRLLRQIPRALLFLPVAPIPFAAPKIGLSLARYARAVLPNSD